MPDDTSPHGGEAMHPLPDRARIPDPKPGDTVTTRSGEGAPSAAQRPPLPERSERMAADVEDEEADPVIESGPGVSHETGKPSVTRQPGEGD